MFGSIGVTQQIDVSMQQSQGMKTGVFTWTRKGSIGRPLYQPWGKQEFYPGRVRRRCGIKSAARRRRDGHDCE